MTAQESIKKFMAALNTQNYSDAISALDDAVKSSSRFTGIQNLIDNFLADQKTVERDAIKTILGSNYKSAYDGMQLSDLVEMAEDDEELATLLSVEAKYDNTNNYGSSNTFTTVERIKILTAETFLKDYCGIELERYVWPSGNTSTYYKNYTTGNIDTGAITGSDAGGDTVKDSDTIIQEIGNKYTAKNSTPQIITTGTNDWIVSATSAGDTIYSGGADSIDAAGGADVIFVEGNNATISTGAGDNYADFVSVSKNVKTVSIVDFDEFDTLYIEGDFILASATLDSNDAVTITDTTGNRIFIINGWTSAQNSTVHINGSDLKFGKWLSSFIDYTETASTNTVETETSTASAISVNLDEVTSIGGSFSVSSGNSSTYNASSSSGAVGTVSTEFPNISNFTTHGLTVELWGEATDSTASKVNTLTLDTMSTAQKTIFAGLYKWWIKEGLKLNAESFGLDFTTDGITGANIKVFFYSDSTSDNKNTLALVRNHYSGKDLELGINMAHYSSILESNENGSAKITEGKNSVTHYLDRTIAHELTHAIMAANVSNFNSLPQFITEGLAELVHGIDDERTTRIWDLASGATGTLSDGSTVERLSYALDLDNTSTGSGDAYAGGYMILRYLAKQAAEQTSTLPALGDVTVRVNLTGADNTYYSNLTSKSSVERAVTAATSSNYSVGSSENYSYTFSPGIRQQVYATEDSWTFSGITSNNSIIAGSGNDSATVIGEYNKIYLGEGNDNVSIVGNNNTITTGEGNDSVLIYSGVQSATITDFDVAKDWLYLSSAVSNVTYSDDSIILGNTTIYLDNYNDISDFFDMNIRNGRTNTTLGKLLGVESFDWSAGTYYFLLDGYEYWEISTGVTVFTNIPNENYAKVTIARNGNITIENTENIPDGWEIALYLPDRNSHNLTIGDHSFKFTNSARFIDSYASYGEFVITDNFYFIDWIDDGTFKKLSYSGSGTLNAYNSDYLTIENFNVNEAIVITYDNITESYIATGEYIYKTVSVATYDGNNKISEEVTLYTTEYNSTFSFEETDPLSETGYYIKDYQNSTIKILRGTFENEHTFSILSASNGITLLLNDDNEIVGIDNFDEDESIYIDGILYTLTGGKIIREDEKIYSGDFEEFISNLSNDDYWQVITSFSNTVISGEMYLTGTEAAESFSFSKVTIASGGVLNLDAEGGNDTVSVENISINSGYVTFSGSSDNDSLSVSKVTITGGNLGIAGDSGADTISVNNVTISNSEIDAYGGTDKDTISVSNVSVGNGGNFYIPGNYGEDSLTVSNVTISGGSVYIRGDDSDDTISATNIKVNSGNLEISGGNGSEKISVSSITGNDKVSIYGDYSTESTDDGNDNIFVTNSSGIKIYSGGGTDTLTFGGSVTATIGDFSANDIISLSSAVSAADFANGVLTFGNVNLNLNGISDISNYEGVVVVNGTTRTTLGDLLTPTGWKVSNGVATFGNLITISGLSTSATADDISLNDKTVTISANALNQNNTVTITSGYTLQLGSDVTTPQTGDTSWTVSNGTARYISAGTSAGYVISNNQIVYQSAGSETTLATISGLSTSATADDISLNDKTVTIAAHALNQNNTVTITSGYTLQLGSDVTTPQAGDTSWTVSNGTARYISAGTSAGYVISNNQIVYQSAGSETTLTTISGLNTAATVNDISLSGTTATISANALNQNNTVTITNGYTLKLASNVKTPTPTSASWTVSNGTAEYISAGTSAGYVISNNQIVYQSAGGGETLIAISGLSTSATTNNISLSGKTVTLSNAALNRNNTVTISDGYNLKLGSDVTKSTETAEGWQVSSGTANYNTASQTAGYSLVDNKISYVSATNPTTLVTVSGLKSTATAKNLSLSDKTVTVAQTAVAKGELTISGGYALTLAKGTYSGISVVGGIGIDTITNSGNSAVISTGNGNDLISLANGTSKNTIIGGGGNDSISATKGKNTYQYATGDGNDTIYGFTTNDTLKITSGNISSWNIDNKNLIFRIGSGSVTILDGAGMAINIVESNTTKASTFIYGENLKYDTKQTAVTLTSNYSGSYTPDSKLKNLATIDGAAVTSAVSITGNSKNNSIIGGTGNDTLGGGSGNDTLTGGSGADIFVYSAGKDVIADYSAEDKISIGSAISNATVKTSKNSSDVIFTVGKGTLTVKDGGGKKITIDDSTYIYESGKIYDGNQTSVTLTSAFKGTLDSGIITADGSDLSAKLQIVGNTSNNTIYGGTGADSLNGGAGNDLLSGGKGNDTLTGGAGNDTLTGGDGNDVFIYEGGNDTITDYTAGKDKIKISADITGVTVSGDDVTFRTADGSLTVKDGAGEKITTINSKNKSTVQIYESGLTFNEKQTAVTLSSNYSGSYTPDSKLKNLVTIDGAAVTSAVSITGNSKSNSIIGGSGNDTLGGVTGNDTLTGGSGADIFVYSAGKDVIADYAAEDKISTGGATISKVTVKKSDVILTVGKGTLTVKDGVGKKITIDDSTYIYESGKIYDENQTSVTLTSAFKGTLDSGIITADGSDLSAKLQIVGNDSNNTIYGGTGADSLNGGAGNDLLSGGKGNDTLTGGAGNDTLTGGDGNDVFIFEGGNDLITDYTAGKDKIKISSEFTWSISGKNVIFETDEGTITVENGAGKKITTLNAKNKSTTQTYSATGANTLDLFEDNNFISEDVQLSSITEITADNYSVGKIETENYLALENNENILTYGKDK